MKVELTEEQKKILRWGGRPDFLSRPYVSSMAEAELNAATLDFWTEFLQA